MTIRIEAGKDWFLRSTVQGTDWGPFDTEAKAWHHLFGRESTNEEQATYKRAGWSAFQVIIPLKSDESTETKLRSALEEISQQVPHFTAVLVDPTEGYSISLHDFIARALR